MQKMFIASSTEARTRGITDEFARAVKRVMKNIELQVWVESFEDSTIIIHSLLEAVRNCQFGAFILTKDDEATIRGIKTHVPRGNVLVELGMFLSQLSLGRVAIVVEKGVDIPNDLDGVVPLMFELTDGLDMHYVIDPIVEQLARRLRRNPDLSGAGFQSTLSQMRKRVSDLETRLVLSSDADGKTPIILDSRWCEEAYVEAQKNVQRRFWTTTFLDSGFWSESMSGSVMASNELMLDRLKQVQASSVRRIFLLPVGESEFLNDEQRRVESHCSRGEFLEVGRRLRRISQLRQFMTKLSAEGCEVRVSFGDDDLVRNTLSSEVRNWHDVEAEIAIFDDFRIDSYLSGAEGVVGRLVSFTHATSDFGGHLHSAEAYFRSLWESGKDPFEFFDSWEERVSLASGRIDYMPNWLVKFDFHLSPEDARLKDRELEAAVDQIVRHFAREKPARYLDVGTCTGRYPLNLLEKELLAPGARVTAIDSDDDCVEYTEYKLNLFLKDHPKAPDISIVPGNFLQWAPALPREDRFDLITCMLGTLSHFGVPSNKRPAGYVEDGLAAMIQRLANGGMLLIANWSEQALRHKKLLAIYTQNDTDRIIRWTPSRASVEAALAKAELKHVLVNILNRIDLFAAWRDG